MWMAMGQDYYAVVASAFGGAVFMTVAWVYWKIRLVSGGGFGPGRELSVVGSVLGMMALGSLVGFVAWKVVTRRKRYEA